LIFVLTGSGFETTFSPVFVIINSLPRGFFLVCSSPRGFRAIIEIHSSPYFNLRNTNENAFKILLSTTLKDEVKMRNFVGVLFWCANLEYLRRLYSDHKSMTGKRINRFPWKSCQALLRVTFLRWARTYKFLVSCWNPTRLEYFNSAELLL